MKGISPYAAGILLLLLSAGLLGLTGGDAAERRMEQVAVLAAEQELGAGTIAYREQAGQIPAPSPSPSPAPAEPSEETVAAPVPVATVEEAWDERARQRETVSEPSPEPAAEAPAESEEPVEPDADMTLELRNDAGVPVDLTALPALPGGLALQTELPTILIVHTHTTESYTKPGQDPDSAVYRSREESDGVMAVGDAMAETLEARGYHVIHDKTFCDYPEYNGAYNRSRAVVRDNLERYPSLCLVLDVHRDAAANADGSQMRTAVSLGGADTARVMLVVGTDQGGLEHPNWRQNLSLAAVLQGTMNRTSPGLARPVNLRSERFNQDLGAMSLLVEVGSSGDTLEEALRGATRFSEALGEALDRYCGKSS